MSCCLRPWTLNDAEAVVCAFGAPGMDRQGGPITTTAQAADWLEPRLWGARPATRAFAVDLAGTAVGNVMLSDVDEVHQTAWVSYWMSTSVRGRGIATRATASLAHWALADLGLFRLELGHRVNNPASGKVATNAGFVREGVERGKLRYGAERFDVAVYARLATDPAPPVELLPLNPGAAPNQLPRG